MSLSNTILKVRLPSGNLAVYELQPQYLNLKHFNPERSLSSIARAFGQQLWHSANGCWYEAAGPLKSAWNRVTDPDTIALIERLPLED